MKNRLFRDLNGYLKEIFGQKVYKITIDAGLSCPNRENGSGCIYCNDRGSGTGLFREGLSVKEQIERGIEGLKRRYNNVNAFIAYFQSYTNTYADVKSLEKIWSNVRDFREIVALSVGTRPDCVNKENLSLLNSFSGDYKIFLELGLQSTDEKNLNWIKRGHSLEDFEKALDIATNFNFDIVVHIIFGFPNDNVQSAVEMARYLSKRPVNGVKIHLLYVSKNAPLKKLYEEGLYTPITRELYTDMVVSFISHLRSDIVIHRLTGDAHKGELIAPLWSADKTGILTEIRNKLVEKGLFQGKEINI
ncbi:MAG: TIGR01212 family radical SAM protein [Proteobacteria bacterium]|nr:TIGR01212 family radical SAM protein [Pseudomonadota bacterium]